MSEYNHPLMKNTLTFEDRESLANFILTSDKFTQGEKVSQFEEEWSKWIGAKHSLFVSSGSTANFLLVAAMIERFGLKKGDRVLLPACTWVTNINPIIQLGLTPVFCDVNLKDFSFDYDDLIGIKQKNQHPSQRIKAVFVTHLLGFPANVSKIKEIFPQAIIIDDVCESHGCRSSDGSRVGSNSFGATFSFYYGHHMSTIEGGMISTNDADLYDLMKMKRSHGLARASQHFDSYAEKHPEIDRSFLFVSDGYNFRNTEIAAHLGLGQIKKLDSYIETRRKNFSVFCDAINSSDLFYPIDNNPDNSSFCFPFICEDRETKFNLMTKFIENGIEYRPVVGGNLLRQPYLNGYNIEYTTKERLNADIIHENGVYIGNNQFVGVDEMRLIEKIIGEL